MLALAILIFGLLIVLIIAAAVLLYLGIAPLFAWVVPAICGMLTIGTILLASVEVLMFFGNTEDRKIAKRDFALFIPTIAISALLSWVSSMFLWH